MANIGDGKRYGLIPGKKAQLSIPKPGNIFGDNSDSDSDNGTDWMKKSLKSTAAKGTVKKQTQLDMQRAEKEDPTIYQYDEIYDKMQQEKCDVQEQKKVAKKPRYMANLIRTAERRKMEQEHRIERMVQKEREAEGEQFADKESFITSAYKAKLEEFKKLEEEEKRLERLEEIADVTKQRDMTGFYRHLYRQKVERTDLGEAQEKEPEKESEKELSNVDDLDRDDVISSASESAAESNNDDKRTDEKKNKLKRMRTAQSRRQYRKKVVESESDASTDDEDEDDADEDEEEEEETHDIDNGNEEPESKKLRLDQAKLETEKDMNERLKAAEDNFDQIIKRVAGDTKEELAPVVVEVKRSIWEKRCQGDLFEEAVRRYYGRKAERMANNVVY